MSRLMNPGIGDYLDRLTILELKVQYGNAAGKNVEHFERERGQVLGKINGSTRVQTEMLTALAVVNARLWQAEDQLREYRRNPQELLSVTNAVTLPQLVEVRNLAFRIQDMNDHRAALIRQINAHSGDDQGPEKL
jgi:hypothetical protein